jgi:hypothetical protein
MSDKSVSHRQGTSATPSPDHDAFAQTVKASLRTAKEKAVSIRKTDTLLFVTNVVSPAAATLLAAFAAAIGGNRMFAQAATQTEDGGWKLACILVAIFGFIATVTGMFKKQYDDRLAQGNQCVGRLLTLDSNLATGSSSWEDATKEYGEIVKSFSEFVS